MGTEVAAIYYVMAAMTAVQTAMALTADTPDMGLGMDGPSSDFAAQSILQADEEAKKQLEEERKKAALALRNTPGNPNNLTGGLGVTTAAPVLQKKLLGA
ncbi:MAG: hypothetical protein HQL51_12315 [Magnetococcales bacterium]|nr:hypothetical protein [Magnetococcales bacterium]